MYVKLIAHTPEPDKVVAAAAKLCYSASSAVEIFDGLTGENCAKFLQILQKSGHMSPFEHANFTFAIDGISRVTSHQLVRHRMASFSQQSQRYVGMEENDCVLPPSLDNIEGAKEVFMAQVKNAKEAYNKLIALGVPKEDARFVLPHGGLTRVVVTMNARELHHFFSLRICHRAQWEIQALAVAMLKEVKRVAPLLFSKAGPSCVSKGKCEEARPCGNPINPEEL